MRMIGLYGRCSFGSRILKTIAPIIVRKKKVYSPRPLKVTKARKLPKIMYSDEHRVEKMSALSGASDSVVETSSDSVSDRGSDRSPTYPTWPRNRGSQFLFDAATIIRLPTKAVPSNEPATTRQIKAAATRPTTGPRRWLNAVYMVSHGTAVALNTEDIQRPRYQSWKRRPTGAGRNRRCSPR